MHRSYQSNRPVQIIRYANRIEIQNPGYSLKSQDRFEDSGSFIRNPAIAEILHETRFAETKGSGIRVMRQKMAQSGLAAPTFESDRDADDFEATFLFHHFLDEKDVAWLGLFKGMELTQDQMKALIFVREVGAINNSIYRSLTQTDTLLASKSLRKLRIMNLLLEQGSGTRTTYVPGLEMISRLNMEGVAPTIHDNGAIMDGREALLLLAMLEQEVPVPLRSDVKHAQLTKRLSPESAILLIERLCTWRPLSIAEISHLLRKSNTHISQKYVTPLVSEGRLTYLIPEMPQHPGQKYKGHLKPAKKSADKS